MLEGHLEDLRVG